LRRKPRLVYTWSLSEIWLGSMLYNSFVRYAWEYHATQHRPHCVKTWRHPHNRKYITYHNAARGGQFLHENLMYSAEWEKTRLSDFRVMRADRQTDRQTDKQTCRYPSQYFAPFPGKGTTKENISEEKTVCMPITRLCNRKYFARFWCFVFSVGL